MVTPHLVSLERHAFMFCVGAIQSIWTIPRYIMLINIVEVFLNGCIVNDVCVIAFYALFHQLCNAIQLRSVANNIIIFFLSLF